MILKADGRNRITLPTKVVGRLSKVRVLVSGGVLIALYKCESFSQALEETRKLLREMEARGGW